DLGPAGVLAALRTVPLTIHPEQINRLNDLVALNSRMALEDPAVTAKDPDFLIDCFEDADPAVRIAAKAALAQTPGEPVASDPTSSGFCARISRRNFLSIGGLALGGLSMPQILAAATNVTPSAAPRKSAPTGGLGHKAVIMVYLPGGPPHQDTYDLKMDAPSDVRGPLRPIKTNVDGIQICELMPRLARMMDKLVPIRSIVGAKDRHESFQCLTGRLNE